MTGGTITGDLRVRGNFIVGDVVVAMDANGRLHISKGVVSDGDLAAFGAEESEGGGSCGLDIARLWEELKAEDASKVIDVSHIPGSVVLQDELTEILDDYPLITEMNTALGGKADKDWVEEELAKYLLLTGGKISGDLEVTGTLKIGDAVLSYADGRLHVSSTVTSDGDFVAYGDDEGGTAGGGLDVARLWEELGGTTASKVIGVSHIPDIELSKISDLHASWDSVLASQKPAWLTAVSLSTISDLHASWDDMLKAKKPTTLAGYGIADAYTKTEIDGELEKYVTLADNQDITGVKTFVNGIKIGSISLSVVDGRLHVSSTVTSDGDFVAFGDEDGASGSGGLDIARLWQELEADDSSKVIDASHIPSITVSKISDFPDKWPWADISGKPSTFAPSAHSHAISEVTGLQGELNSKWVWSESQVKAVKVNNAVNADNADTLDGIHASELLTQLESNSITNLSLTVGKKNLYVTDLYARYADSLRTARKINGTSFNGAHEITTEKWGMARLVSIKDYTQDNAGATKSVDGQESFSLLLPQSIKVKTLDVDGVTLSVIDGRLHISATATSAGDFVAYGDDEGGAGVLDVDKLWQELGGSVSSKVISIEHIPSIPTSKITGLDNALASYATRAWVQQQGYLTSVPKATSSAYGGIKIGYPETGKNYPVELDSSGRAYVNVPWVNTTYSLSSFGITATAEEINKLDGVGTLLHSGNYTSYTVTKTGEGASGTWPISISGNAATADVSNYLYLNPNNGTHASQNDAVPANGRFAIYDVNTATTAGGSDGYIMAFRWPSGNFATQVFLDADSTGIMALRHRSNSNVWTDWYRILHIGNIGSYALTPSNYTSYTVTKTGGGASGTWPISISGNAASATRASYITPRQFGNQGTIGALKSSILAAMDDDSLLKYPGQSYITSGSNITTIMNNWSNDGFSIPAGSQEVFTRLDDYGSSKYGVFLVSGYSGSFYRLLRNDSSTWAGPYALLDTGNYTSHLDSRYVKKSGDTMTGQLIITTSNDDILIFNDTAGEKYFRIKAKANGTDWGGLVLDGRSSVQNLYLGTSTIGYKVWHSGNDGSGSGLDADLLDGVQGSVYRQCQSAVNCVDITVGGDANTYYPVCISANSNHYPATLLNITRAYNETAPNSWNTSTHKGGLTLCILWNSSKFWDGNGAGDVPCINVLQNTQIYSTMVGGIGTSTGGLIVWLRGGTAVYHLYSNFGRGLAVTVYIGTYTDSASRTFSPKTTPSSIAGYQNLYVNSNSATKLQTSSTLWGQPFDGTGNVSGAMTGVTSIDSSLFELTTAAFHLYDSASHAKRLTFNWSSDITRIYAINNSGSGYYDMSLGQSPGNSGALYFDASAACWGIGTASPAYKLDVAGTLRATDIVASGKLFVPSSEGNKKYHLRFE